MWINPLFDITQRNAALDIVRENPLATLISTGAQVRISHMPLLLETLPDGKLELIGHIPHVDPLSQEIIQEEIITSVFQGPQSYISPSWYVEPGLPTYNFLVAHLTGKAQPMKSDEELRTHLLDLIDIHESQCPISGAKWEPDDVAFRRIDYLLPRIMGFRIKVDQFEAKAKLGQNRSVADQLKAAKYLHTSPQSNDQKIAKLMEHSSQHRTQGMENGT